MDFQGISGAWLDELKQKVDIVQLISASVALSRKGNLWWGCCPFHHEKTPSFAVDERKGYYRCYGCHEGGDIISWVQKTESLEFMDAVKYLAKIAGMKVPETQRDAKAVARRERLLGMMKLAARHYYENLGKNPRAQEYLRSRGLSEGLVRHFGLGYSQGGQALIKTLSDAGYSLKEMQDCSLIGTNSEDGTHYDFLANRLIVPVFDAYGNVVAFGGRILEKREGVAKYKNSRETELFQKSRTLYGLNFVKKYRM
ncbi:MAG: DNA primase, partial [Clostridia bacterium]|nr:DNA primase [Clostridia bacterium]